MLLVIAASRSISDQLAIKWILIETVIQSKIMTMLLVKRKNQSKRVNNVNVLCQKPAF